MKKCSSCCKNKNLTEFYKNKTCKGGLNKQCKDCTKANSIRYSRSKIGLITKIYIHQVYVSKKDKTKKLSYTKKELIDWFFNNIKFDKLYNNWVNSGYDKKLTPSVDRINDHKGYSLDNIQLMTWDENIKKSYSDIVNGRNNKKNKAVLQFSLNNILIKEYHSINEASRKTNIPNSNITCVCLGKRKTAGGFVWKHK